LTSQKESESPFKYRNSDGLTADDRAFLKESAHRAALRDIETIRKALNHGVRPFGMSENCLPASVRGDAVPALDRLEAVVRGFFEPKEDACPRVL
jgi:hypothetical protein